MRHPDNTASTCAAQWKMWLLRIVCVIYFTAVCAAQDEAITKSRDTLSPTALTAVVTTVHVPPMPSLKLQSLWLDVFPSEKVEFRCTFTGSSDWSIVWSRNEEQVEDSDPNVSLSTDRSILTITAANPIYSGSYSCKGQHKRKVISTADSNTLQLTVHANKPKPTVSQKPEPAEMFPGESVTFTCTVSPVSSGWEYLWFHDGKEVHISSSYTINPINHADKGKYHCQAKRGKVPFHSEKSMPVTLQVSDPPTPSLKLLTSWLDVFQEEIVAFSCEVSASDWTFTWHRNKTKLLDDDDALIIDEEGTLLNITSVSKDHEGVYACQAHLESRNVSSEFSNTATVKVYDNTPKPALHKDPGFNPMYVGEKVSLTCNVNVASGWEYQWYKNKKDQPATSKTNSFQLGLSDGGEYSCKATRSKTTSTEDSEEMQLTVVKVPVPSLTPVTPWLDVFPDELVQLKCEMNSGSEWTYTWFRDGREVRADGVVSLDNNGALLSINSASAAHAGQYKCKGQLEGRPVRSNSSLGLTLSLYAEKPSAVLTQDPDYKVMFSGEPVSLTCHMNVSSGWDYTWYKDGTQLVESGGKYGFSSVSTENDGLYGCKAKRGTMKEFLFYGSQDIRLQVKGKKPKPLMTQQPNVEKVYVGELVSFECKVELSSGWRFQWYKNDTPLAINGNRFNINTTLSDSGVYKCIAIRDKTQYHTEHSDTRTLLVSEIPVPTLKLETPWLDVFPSETVKLSCGMLDGSSDWTYTWYKDDKMVNDTVSFDNRRRTTLTITASDLHRGQYSCDGKIEGRSVLSRPSSGLRLSIYDAKPRVTLTRTPAYDVMHTEDSVSFHCHINVSSGWQYLWFKDNSPIIESTDSHTITSAVTANTGSYQCQVKRGSVQDFKSDKSKAVNIKILERPQASIDLLTGWSEVFSTDSLVLKCEVQDSNLTWNYTWFKEGKSIDQLVSARHTVTPENNPEQSQFTCRGIRDGRPKQSKLSEQFKTKNLLLKRRVLLSISGCIFFGIIAVILGCIVLRVFRKPAEEEERLEEADLFLTMAQQKGADVPCPLVEYITDATLNAPSKEVEENGTICSETTPLPITVQEDQAVTTESLDTEDNNGGLVSFKQ
ncbi:hemicentin-1 isoform X2 [Cheilinus undulatus]|uniref:hemicentin-1 isoform X2 n=1 Tax=Cheilinus undulatus TaxID=241271 RepID=UPI001BD27322|nr:hemicentin-1 isoform X2 [Cheilinus undulatus]